VELCEHEGWGIASGVEVMLGGYVCSLLLSEDPCLAEELEGPFFGEVALVAPELS
jgi:hypothetical protein